MCNDVLSTYDVSHVINFTRLSPLSFRFSFTRGESLGTRLSEYSNLPKNRQPTPVLSEIVAKVLFSLEKVCPPI